MIVYEPSKILSKTMPKKRIKKLLSDSFAVKKTALNFVDKIPFLNKSQVLSVALKAVKGYRERVKGDPKLAQKILDNPVQLIQRVQNEVVLQVGSEIRNQYAGEYYIWLPSDAEEPDPEHQLNYGKKFQVGDGEQPGDRYGCRCGMQILVDEKNLNLGE